VEEQTDIRDFLEELQKAPELISSQGRRAKMGHCMRHFAAKGIPLSVCCGARHLKRSLSTLKAYARDLRLRFPDYVPMDMREPHERKRK